VLTSRKDLSNDLRVTQWMTAMRPAKFNKPHGSERKTSFPQQKWYAASSCLAFRCKPIALLVLYKYKPQTFYLVLRTFPLVWILHKHTWDNSGARLLLRPEISTHHSQVIRQVFSVRQRFVNTRQYLAILSNRISMEG